jgi:cystathionine gamma-synthase
VIGGVLAVSDPELGARLAFFQNAAGGVPGPLDCYLVMRGVKTLAVRMDRHCANAAAVAGWLADHPAVSAVRYPGLESHPGHEVAKRQMTGFGGMVSFVVASGEAAALEVAASTTVFTLAESLGAVESLIEHPHRMTHASTAGSALQVDPGLLRLSVGIETLSDLLEDLEQALENAL